MSDASAWLDVQPDSGLQNFLDERRQRHGVAAASLAILREGRVLQAASGVLNLETGVDVTPSATFQIGSAGKLFTATLMAQLVDEGLADLDAPVRRYLPDFQIADHDAAERMTLRHLLTHTSGMEGDFIPPDDAWGGSSRDYVRRMALLPQLHAPGEFMSYCNSGYVLAGRVIEILRRMPWPQAVMQFICRPLGMQHVYAQPAESLRYRSAMGHVTLGDKIVLAPVTYLPASIAAAGSVLTMSAADLLRFASMHMHAGSTPDGRRIVSAAMAAQMQTPQVELLPHSRIGFNRMGLAWFIGEHPHLKVIGHDGATAGQWTYLQCIPQRKLAYALLTNSPSNLLAEDVRRHFFEAVAGSSVPLEPAPGPGGGDGLEAYPGVYENLATRIEIRQSGAGLTMAASPKRGDSGKLLEARLSPYSPACFQIESNDPAARGRLGFAGVKDGRARYVRLGVRLARRVH